MAASRSGPRTESYWMLLLAAAILAVYLLIVKWDAVLEILRTLGRAIHG